MKTRCILTDYFSLAMENAAYEKLQDESYCGRIPACPGVIAFAASLTQCQHELRATLEDWLLLGLKLGHALPVIDGIDLNQEPQRDAMESLQAK